MGEDHTSKQAEREAAIEEANGVVRRILDEKADDLRFQSAVRGLKNSGQVGEPVKRPSR